MHVASSPELFSWCEVALFHITACFSPELSKIFTLRSAVIDCIGCGVNRTWVFAPAALGALFHFASLHFTCIMLRNYLAFCALFPSSHLLRD